MRFWRKKTNSCVYIRSLGAQVSHKGTAQSARRQQASPHLHGLLVNLAVGTRASSADAN